MNVDIFYIREEICAAITHFNNCDMKTAVDVLRVLLYSIDKDIDKEKQNINSDIESKIIMLSNHISSLNLRVFNLEERVDTLSKLK